MTESRAARLARELTYPPDFFDPPDPRPDFWPDNPDLRRAVDWFKSFISPQQWVQRREQAARRLYLSALGIGDEGGRFFDAKDSFGWYLFLAEAVLDHIGNYDYVFGSRVVPVFQAIGRDLHLLRQVEGSELRVQRMVTKERGQPNGGLFELLVAACYRRAGATVAFVDEKPGKKQTHDMDVTLHGQSWAVECKRMEVGEYAESERLQLGRLWSVSSAYLAGLERSTLCQASFRVELASVPGDYLKDKVHDWLASKQDSQAWDDAIASGNIGTLDLRPLQAVLSKDLVLGSSHRILELLTGRYVRNAAYQTLLRTMPGENPRYVDACNLAVVLNWESLSEAALDKKARDIRKNLSNANAQLPDGRPCVVHIGFEAVEGDRVERLRYDKILATARQFDPGEKQLEYIYCHYFVPESPPDQSWAFDETTQWCAIRATQKKPLERCFLVLASGVANRSGPHWQE
ncbi:hypothetical protein QTI51_37320 [Variovorax sp. J22G73]|uniref:hypothetical protein n=1 Tax=unclassified Variovorax TaxID=663243 RepID=UPI002575AEDC|nr:MULTISPECIES: hypothetical protein [unclassified Variovorax]MDM0010151.1 hypothetical protein [Variovorax sp. J22R203]MDM0102987.1 hypothetical protein [Variovorax sp. J22G73]